MNNKDLNWLDVLKIVIDCIKNIFIFIFVIISAFWSALVNLSKKY